MAKQRPSTRRRQQEVAALIKAGTDQVADIAEALGISPSTIRRDLASLEDLGEVTRVLGGAVPASPLAELEVDERSRVAPEAKRAIAAAAADLIPTQAKAIFLDAGSTTGNMIPFLETHKPIKVATRGLDLALALSENPEIAVQLLGGRVHWHSRSTSGPLYEIAAERLSFDDAFFGCDSVSATEGIGEPTLQEARTKELIARRSRLNVVLAHADILGARQNAWAPLPRGWVLVTDERSGSALAPFRAAGVRVISVQTAATTK